MNGATLAHGSARTPKPAVAAARYQPAHRAGRPALVRARAQRRAPVLLYIVTPGRYFLSHRLPVACAAAAAGWDVHVAAPAGEAVDRIAHAQITVHDTRLYRSVVSPFVELASLLALIRLCRRIRPSLIHAVAPKAAVLGGLAARALGIPAVIMKGGLCSADTARGSRMPLPVWPSGPVSARAYRSGRSSSSRTRRNLRISRGRPGFAPAPRWSQGLV